MYLPRNAKLSAAAVMRRAWAIFRETYDFPAVPFRAIGRKCFASALRRAWAEAKHIAELAALGVDRLASELARLDAPVTRCGLTGPWSLGPTTADFATKARSRNLRTALALASQASAQLLDR